MNDIEHLFPDQDHEESIDEGAGRYRYAEYRYFHVMQSSLRLKENPPPYLSSQRVNNTRYAAAIEASLAYKTMQQLAEEFHFLIGGEDGSLRVGESHAYESHHHFYANETDGEPPEEGDEVVVFLSEVATIENGEKKVRLPAVFIHPES